MSVLFDKMLSELRKLGGKRIAVAAAEDSDVLGSVLAAAELGVARPILLGSADKIKEVADGLAVSLDNAEILDVEDAAVASREAVRLVREARADAVMKGLVPTSTLLKAVLNRETGIRQSPLLSHLAMFEIEALGRPLFITDAALCIAPNLDEKEAILNNAVAALRLLDYECPQVACVCALEKVNPAMSATVDAAALVERNAAGRIAHCRVGGPFALDNALFEEAALLKGVADPVAGKADLLLMPAIEAANVLYKSLAFLQGLPAAALVLGAAAPVIVTSRADHKESKLRSILLSLYLSAKAKGEI